MEPEQLLFAIVFVIGMFAGVVVIFLAMRQRALQMEMQHRERMAMIEKGQVPQEPPRIYAGSPTGGGSAAGLRSITLGIVVISIGLGLMTIISLAGQSPEIGIGVGGAICIVGGGFIASGMLRRSQGALWPGESHNPFDRREP
jgi:hypothetical protein